MFHPIKYMQQTDFETDFLQGHQQQQDLLWFMKVRSQVKTVKSKERGGPNSEDKE